MKTWLRKEIGALYPDVDFEVMVPPDEKLGDYSINLPFVLAKQEKRNPNDIGKEVLEKLSKNKEFENNFSKIEAAGGGFINFYLSQKFLQNKLTEIHGEIDSFGKSDEGKGKTVIVEYSSPNIAKPMHIGHLRSTIIGDALANVYEALGYNVIRWNFIGDWGTQFGKLIAAYKKWGDEKVLEKDPINEMLRLYVKFHEEMKSNPELEKEGQEEFKKLENGDEENKNIWKLFREDSLKEFSNIYAQLGMDIWNGKFKVKGESDYESKLKPLIEELKNKGLAKESEGALIIELDNIPPAMLQKSDGATLYITRDLASLEDRIKEYKPERILYVVANQQALHFEQLFAIAEKLGWVKDKPILTHVKFGMVLGEDGKKLATREGRVIPLQEVIDKIQEKAYSVVKNTKPANAEMGDEEARNISRAVGIAALKYNDLRQHPHSDITFDWDAMLDLRGNSGPYLQYTYARLNNIFNKAEGYKKGDVNLLVEPSERKIMRKLLDFPDAVVDSTKFYTLNGLSLYLYELAGASNYFYEQVRVLQDENTERRNARLLLIETTMAVLKRGLNLLGVETLERI